MYIVYIYVYISWNSKSCLERTPCLTWWAQRAILARSGGFLCACAVTKLRPAIFWGLLELQSNFDETFRLTVCSDPQLLDTAFNWFAPNDCCRSVYSDRVFHHWTAHQFGRLVSCWLNGRIFQVKNFLRNTQTCLELVMVIQD